MIAVATDFAKLEPGDEIPTTAVDLAPAYVAAYAREIGMDAARFTNPEGARKEGLPRPERIGGCG